MNFIPRMNFILGAGGRLGRALTTALGEAHCRAVPRETYGEWWREDGAERALRYFQEHGGAGCRVLVAAGVVDPARPMEEHERANFLLPRHVAEAGTTLGFQVLTFGTVMETLLGDRPVNAYYASKIALNQFLANADVGGGRHLHVRIHTLYGGGLPAPGMFLGQMLRALAEGSPFRMSPGEQFREYHHVDDDARAIARMAAEGRAGSVDLSHGRPVQLRALAAHVFEHLGASERLAVGALPAPGHDNFGHAFAPTTGLDDVGFRDTLPGVTAYLRECLANAQGLP